MVLSLASTAFGMHLLHVSILLPSRSQSFGSDASADCRSQYYPSSNVQASDSANDLSDDELPLSVPVDPLDSVDGSRAERHPHSMRIPGPNSPSLQVSRAALQSASMRGCPNLRQPIGASRGGETTPLLRKAASFTVPSSHPTPASAGRMNYKSLGRPDGPTTVPQDSIPVPASTTVVHHYKGKSTYGQTVSLVNNHLLKR